MEAAAPQAAAEPDVRRQRGSIPSFLFITFLLFMLTHHSSDEFVARNQYQAALNNLTYQASNFSAWLNGTDSNFTLPSRDSATDALIKTYMAPLGFGLVPDPLVSSYYTNISGFVNGDMKFHNISDHRDIITDAEMNVTEVQERLGQWNWTASDKVQLSFVEKDERTVPGISLVHGRIDITDQTMQELHMDFHGVHFLQNGSIYAIAEAGGRKIDIRNIPSLVPAPLVNETASTIVPELERRIRRLQELVDAGSFNQDLPTPDESPVTTCPFEFYGQVQHANMSYEQMRSVEDELSHPTGISTTPVPKMNINGALVSRECGIVLEIKDAEGMRSRRFFRKVTTYAGFSCVVYLGLIIVFARQQSKSLTPSALSRISRWTFVIQSMIDLLSFGAHFTFSLMAEERVGLSLIATSMMASMLSYQEGQFAALIHQIQLPEDTASPPATDPAINSDPQSLSEAVILWTRSFFARVRSRLSVPPTIRIMYSMLPQDPQFRLLIFTLIFLLILSRIVLSPSAFLFTFSCMHIAIWMSQTVRAARRGRSSALTMEYLIGTTIGRLWMAGYFLLCPANVLEVRPRGWMWLLGLFMFLQVGLLWFQDQFGPAFFLPGRFQATQVYNYHPSLPISGGESSGEVQNEITVGDCVICMDSIDVPRPGMATIFTTGREVERDEEKGFLLDERVDGEPSTVRSKVYSLAPCNHLFHTACLEQWLAIKNICPQCRRPLPPL